MRIAIGSDHRGFEVKRRIGSLLERLGHQVVDMGPTSGESVDYPDYAIQVAKAVSDGSVERGILVCGTSIGMCIVANKVRGVRAAPCHDSITAEMSRRHNDANVLILPARFVSEDEGVEILKTWLDTQFEGGRHSRRVAKIDKEGE